MDYTHLAAHLHSLSNDELLAYAEKNLATMHADAAKILLNILSNRRIDKVQLTSLKAIVANTSKNKIFTDKIHFIRKYFDGATLTSIKSQLSANGFSEFDIKLFMSSSYTTLKNYYEEAEKASSKIIIHFLITLVIVILGFGMHYGKIIHKEHFIISGVTFLLYLFFRNKSSKKLKQAYVLLTNEVNNGTYDSIFDNDYFELEEELHKEADQYLPPLTTRDTTAPQ